jgi:hypothetical protein
VSADVESARLEWEEAYRRLEHASRGEDPRTPLHEQVDVLVRELRKRVGSNYTLRELGAEYRRAEPWVRDVVAERAPAPGWPLTLSLVEGAAFHLVSLGAVDYEP